VSHQKQWSWNSPPGKSPSIELQCLTATSSSCLALDCSSCTLQFGGHCLYGLSIYNVHISKSFNTRACLPSAAYSAWDNSQPPAARSVSSQDRAMRGLTVYIHHGGIYHSSYGYYNILKLGSKMEKRKQFFAAVGFRKWTLVVFWILVIWVPMLQMDRCEY
jgi:hypothetical protein